MMKTLLKIILPVIILVVTVGYTVYQIKHKPIPEKMEKKKMNPIVRTVAAVNENYIPEVEGFGTVQASASMNIVNDTAGRVIYVNPLLKSGAVLKKGELLYSIETESYEAALASAKSNLREAQYQLAKIEQEADVSMKEWEIWNSTSEKANKPSPLIKYEPQKASAQAAVEYAEKSVKKAELDLMKTAYRAPFDCIVSEENIELGMVIKSGESAGVLVGSESYEVVVPVLAKDEADIVLSSDRSRASEVDVILTEGPKSWKWKGYASRTLPDADSKTGMVKLVVAVPNPHKKMLGRPTLAIGSNVQCIIKGREVDGLVSVPKGAVRDDNKVWVYDNGYLSIRDVEIAGKSADKAYLLHGVGAEELVIVSRINGAVDKMPISMNRDGGAVK